MRAWKFVVLVAGMIVMIVGLSITRAVVAERPDTEYFHRATEEDAACAVVSIERDGDRLIRLVVDFKCYDKETQHE